jgi:ABC-type nickel/cobalt efflux system permease component RcnA
MFASAGAVFLGVLLGLRHAFEPDHLAAVSTLVGETTTIRRGALLGAVWGLGHTISLVLVGGALLLAGASLPARTAAAFELAVAAMLIALGIRAILRGLPRVDRRGPPHAHGARHHAHEGPIPHVHLRGTVLAWRPLGVGLVHGLAGSGALTALAFAELPGTAARVTYVVLFGLGSIAGMSIASGVAGAALSRLSRTPRARRGFALSTGTISIAVGIAWGLPMLARI